MFRRPSPSIVISMLALLIALGGAGYSATGGNFLLGTVNNATSQTRLVAPIAGASLRVENSGTAANSTGLNIFTSPSRPPLVVNSSAKVAKLNADRLDGFDSTAFVRKAIGGWHYIGDPGEPAFQNGWTNLDPTVSHLGAYQQHAAFRIDNNRVVHLAGWVKGGTPNVFFFELVAPYCPKFFKAFPTQSNSEFARVNIEGEGRHAKSTRKAAQIPTSRSKA